MEVDGYYADSAVTVPVGKISRAQKLLDVTASRWDRASTRCGREPLAMSGTRESWVEQNGSQ